MNKNEAVQAEIQTIYQKLTEIELEQEEHKMVIETLKPMEQDRPAYRLINGVLVEKTVGEVLPMLERQLANINSVIATLKDQLAKKQNESSK